MKNNNLLALFAVFLLSLGIVFCGNTFAQDNDPNEKGKSVTKVELNTNVEKIEDKAKQDEDKKILQEALNAYEKTLEAVEHLDKGEKDKALEVLEQAVGKLDILIGRYPEVAFLPISMDVQTFDVVNDLDTIKRQRDEVEFLVKQGYLQAARQLLQYMASEVRITSFNLPMETYPTAIRGVARLIEEDKLDVAKRSLATTLSTIVSFERSIPIPVLNSQILIVEASKIIDGTAPVNLTKEKKDEALALLKRAHEELKIAEELGYGKRNWEFAELHKDIKEIEDKVKKNEKSTGLFDKLKKRLETFKTKVSK